MIRHEAPKIHLFCSLLAIYLPFSFGIFENYVASSMLLVRDRKNSNMANNDLIQVALARHDVEELRFAYEQEYVKLKQRMDHVGKVLESLGSEIVGAEGSAVAAARRPAPQVSMAADVEKQTRRRSKKRGPKSVWGNFILRRLRQADRPVSYAEMIRDAMVLHNLPESKRKNARASILNAAFRLRAIHERIDTVGEEGKKEKYLVMSKWLDENKALIAPYAERYRQLVAQEKDDNTGTADVASPGESKAAPVAVEEKAANTPSAEPQKKPTSRKPKQATPAKAATKPAAKASAKPAAKAASKPAAKDATKPAAKTAKATATAKTPAKQTKPATTRRKKAE